MEEIRIDVTKQSTEELALAAHYAGLVFRFNNAVPFSEEWTRLQKEIFHGRIGEGSRVMSPLTAVRPNKVSIGRNAVVMNGCLMMSAGGIDIDDDVQIAANVQLIRTSLENFSSYDYIDSVADGDDGQRHIEVYPLYALSNLERE